MTSSRHCFSPDYTSEHGEQGIVLISEGELGYLRTPLDAPTLDEAVAMCDQLNEALGHTHDEWRAMVARSMNQTPPPATRKPYIYYGTFNPDPADWQVFVQPEGGDAVPLPLRLDLYNHSPTGFCWGYLGSGPAQTALAILAHLYDDETAMRLYQGFKDTVISQIGQEEGWTLTEEAIDRWRTSWEDVAGSERRQATQGQVGGALQRAACARPRSAERRTARSEGRGPRTGGDVLAAPQSAYGLLLEIGGRQRGAHGPLD